MTMLPAPNPIELFVSTPDEEDVGVYRPSSNSMCLLSTELQGWSTPHPRLQRSSCARPKTWSEDGGNDEGGHCNSDRLGHYHRGGGFYATNGVVIGIGQKIGPSLGGGVAPVPSAIQ